MRFYCSQISLKYGANDPDQRWRRKKQSLTTIIVCIDIQVNLCSGFVLQHQFMHIQWTITFEIQQIMLRLFEGLWIHLHFASTIFCVHHLSFSKQPKQSKDHPNWMSEGSNSRVCLLIQTDCFLRGFVFVLFERFSDRTNTIPPFHLHRRRGRHHIFWNRSRLLCLGPSSLRTSVVSESNISLVLFPERRALK